MSVSLPGLAARNLLRNKFRTVLTVIGVAVAILAFVLLRTVLAQWTAAADYAAKDRIVTRNKVTFIMPLPRKYIDDVKNIPGITGATWCNWFGAKDPKNEHDFFGTLGCDHKSIFTVYSDATITPEERDRWYADKKGAIIGDLLAKRHGWKVGDTVTLTGTIFPGDWQFTIDGIYQPHSKALDRSTFFFRWDYMNDSIPERARDNIGWITARVDNPTRTADISAQIDKIFDDREVQTLSASERVFNTSFLAGISAILSALDIVSIVILGIMMLILGNTIAMGVRERTKEYGTLRAIGFLPGHLVFLVMAEAAFVGVVGGLLGLAISYPIIEKGLGRFLEENMGQFFPFFAIPPMVAVAALGLAILLAMTASLPPALRAFRLDIVSSLRRVG